MLKFTFDGKVSEMLAWKWRPIVRDPVVRQVWEQLNFPEVRVVIDHQEELSVYFNKSMLMICQDRVGNS